MKIALVGSAPSSVQLAPYMDANFSKWLGGKPEPKYPNHAVDHIEDVWQIWGCSPGAWAVVPRSDRWFEVHRWEPGQPWFSPEYVQFLQTYRGIVYTGGPIDEIPNHEVYPLERVEAEFSGYFLHSSLSLMMAVAILEIEDKRRDRARLAEMRQAAASCEGEPPKPNQNGEWPFRFSQAQLEEPNHEDTIGMWGVDMAAGEEYGDQRAGCQFFILEALRRGIKVYIPPESCLLRPKPVYGISEWGHDYIKMTQRAKEFNTRITAAQGQLSAAQSEIAFISGARDDLNYMINTWTSPYGLPAGQVLSHTPGSGLGGGFTRKPAHTATPEGFVPVAHIEEAPPAPVQPTLELTQSSTGIGQDSWMHPEIKARTPARAKPAKKKAKAKR